MYDTDISYKKKGTDKMYWDKWGNSYKVKKGDKVVSLSSFNKINSSTTSFYSTVVWLGLIVLFHL